jgi:hypothetical protein
MASSLRAEPLWVAGDAYHVVSASLNADSSAWSGSLYIGVEFVPAQRAVWLIDVRIRGVVVGHIRHDTESGTYRYHRLAWGGEASPFCEEKDLERLLRRLFHKP